jgi:hypothetical protein
VNSPAWQRRHRPGDERLRGFKCRIRGARRPTPEWFDEKQSLILAAQIVSSKRVRFCAPVVEKMRNQEIGAALDFKAGEAVETALQTALIAAICLKFDEQLTSRPRAS